MESSDFTGAIEYETVKLYYRIATQITNRAKSKYKNMNHHSGQNHCLLVLDGVDGMEQNELSSRMGIRATSLSELLAKLEKKGFVTRKQSSQNRRTFTVSITPAGHEEAEKSKKLILEDGCRMLEPLSADEKELFYRILEKINEAHPETDESGEEQGKVS